MQQQMAAEMLKADDDIRIEKRGRLGLISLDRGRALNALNLDMVQAMLSALSAWRDDDEVAHVAIRSLDEKAFSAGGDLHRLWEAGFWAKVEGGPLPLTFFQEEYRLNHLIKTYPKPYIALVDGIVMGGGFGVSVHGSVRLAGERINFAMPEVGIGFFPDVGATHFLPQMPYSVGTYLALTGSRIGRADCLWSGIATHAVPARRFDALIEGLVREDDHRRVVEEYAQAPEEERSALADDAELIEDTFSASSIAEILARLAAKPEWERGQKALQAIGRMSPTSLAIALCQMRLGRQMDFAEAMRLEYRIVNRILAGEDFYEGVRAQLIDKDHAPRWYPAGLADVKETEINAYLAPLEEELALPGDRG
ncbi:enoyl-CoA hydratase [Rhodopseudomonas julia]|uniref:3-hydroxyisobutyryl-CoA hydrolase n=1 Tax=Rhodopseudomonas julia TaxID=200617 RepID=A0ABU0C9N0_9BRAD|nr:enoyl-CoA hydratase/isomerase family protein [Rhodopseudomonas julia]MDQ0327237.1 enoyl-CoA hydratase [Rhodopseudomonas julia]